MATFDSIGYWSELKLEILRKYAAAYSTILTAQRGLSHVYVDAFAGAGMHLSRTTLEMVPGSPLNALNVTPPFREYHLIDLDGDKAAALRQQIASRPEVRVYEGDCNDVLLRDVFPRIRYEDYRRGLLLLDPYGLHLDWQVIRAAGQLGTVDMFLNFPVADMNRNVLWRHPENVDPGDIGRIPDSGATIRGAKSHTQLWGTSSAGKRRQTTKRWLRRSATAYARWRTSATFRLHCRCAIPATLSSTICFSHPRRTRPIASCPISSRRTVGNKADMASDSAIEWTNATWNPVTGCTKVSPGCKFCYAERLTNRFGRGKFTDVALHPDRLDLPLRWRAPRMIFVNSMSDLFHERVPFEFIDRVFAVITRATEHTYQVLTKRPDRLVAWHRQHNKGRRVPAHVWLGVSVENAAYIWRIDRLREVDVGVRFISAEPLLGPLHRLDLTGIAWLITGGESGGSASRSLVRKSVDRWEPKLSALDWVRDLRDQCRRAGVAFFHKQWGGPRPGSGGRTLDGREWSEYPSA